MVGPQNGGSLDRVHIESGVPVLSHFFHDLVPYLDCCLLSENCAKYFEKRPSDDGSKYEPPRPGIKDTRLKMSLYFNCEMAVWDLRHNRFRLASS